MIILKNKRGKTSVEDKEYSGRDISSSLNEVQILTPGMIILKNKRGKTSVEDKEYSGRDISSSLNEVQIYWLQGWSFWKIKEARPVLKIKSTVEETLAVV